MIEKIFLVAIGGAIGASLRFLAVGWIGRMLGEAIFGTIFVNVIGSFLMGICAVLMFERAPDGLARVAAFLMPGVFGGFTTFSAFSLDAFRLYEGGRLLAAAGYVGASVMFSIAGLFIGIFLARSALA